MPNHQHLSAETQTRWRRVWLALLCLYGVAVAADIAGADAVLAPRLTEEVVSAIVNLVPDGWLRDVQEFDSPDAVRGAYVSYLLRRLQAPRPFVQEALNARAQLV